MAAEALKPLIQLLPRGEGHLPAFRGGQHVAGAVGHTGDRGVLSGDGDGFSHDPQAVRAPIGPLEIILQDGRASRG